MTRHQRSLSERIDQDDLEILALHLGFRGGFFNAGLRRARLARNLKQTELAKLVREHVGRGHEMLISQYETLKNWPDGEMAEAIATILDVGVDKIFPSWLSVYRQTAAIQEIPLQSLFGLKQAEVEQALPIGTIPELREDDPVASEVVDGIMEGALPGVLDGILSTLPDRERQVLQLRYLNQDGDEPTLQDIAARTGYKWPESVRQVEMKGLHKLRHPSRSKGLRDFLG